MELLFALQQTPEGTASILVNNRMMENYGITYEQLYADAIENAVHWLQASCSSLPP